MSASTIYTHGTKYHHVQQRTAEWHDLRRLGGSQIGAACGLSRYQSPQSLVADFHKPFEGNRFTAHGTAMEPHTDRLFRQWLRGPDVQKHFNVHCSHKRPPPEVIASWRSQSESDEPGYLTLDPMVKHPHFDSPVDHQWFGASLDYEGSVIDAEFKNPIGYMSFYRNYLNGIDCAYFAQVQWIMAMRQRKAMLFVATSFSAPSLRKEGEGVSPSRRDGDKEGALLYEKKGGSSPSLREGEPVLLGMVIWYVRFANSFFREMIYPPAVTCGRAIYGPPSPPSAVMEEGESEVDWIFWENKGGRYAASSDYQKLISRYATRVYVYKNGDYIRKMIEEEKRNKQ